MKQTIKILLALSFFTAFLCSCGDDRSEEYYAVTQENQWIYSKMKEVYLWSNEIGVIEQKTYFSTPKQFFKKLLHSSDNVSFFSEESKTTSHGIKSELLRDPLGISPSKNYALVEFVEPGSAASAAGLERGMWISEIDGDRITTTSNSKLDSGQEVELSICSIEYDETTDSYYWQEKDIIYLPEATEYERLSIPVVTTIDDIAGKSGYILLNSFDSEKVVGEFYEALSSLSAEGINNIVIDLRYNNSVSLSNAAALTAAFIPADKQGDTFCTLSKELVAEGSSVSGETIRIPECNINISDKPLYIITTAETQGVAATFIKGIQFLRGTADVKVLGKPTGSMPLYTERFESPFAFDINPATAYIYDATGQNSTPTLPDFEIPEYEDYYSISPLGNNQEYILYNICYLIANGTIPQPAE